MASNDATGATDEDRDQLAAIIGARRWHTNESGGQHAATADAILRAGWRPPALPDALGRDPGVARLLRMSCVK